MNQSKTFHISSLWFGFFTFDAFMCILCFRWWYVGWPKHGSIGRVLFQTLERQFMTADAITKMFAVWHCFIAPVPFSRKSVRFCRAQVDCHLEQRWNMQSWKRYVHFSLVVRSAWAPIENVDTIYWKTKRMIFMLLMRNFVDHVSFVISSDWNFVRAFFWKRCRLCRLTFDLFDLCQVQVRPLVMGVTEVGRDSSHVLMSMGFREVDNVLTNAVLTGTGAQQFWFFFTDFLLKFNFSKLPSPAELCTLYHFQVYMPWTVWRKTSWLEKQSAWGAPWFWRKQRNSNLCI